MKTDTRWLAPVPQALAQLAAALGPRGQWPGWAFADAAPAAGQRDLAPPLTALGVLALQHLPLPGVAELVQRSAQHLTLTVRPGGLWRYYANIPPDTDDTALCALALGLEHPLVRDQTRASLASTRRADGLFPTWFEPGWAPAVDAVANAHVVAVLGDCAATQAAMAWLVAVVQQEREATESHYYPDPLDLHLALTRAYQHGVTALMPALELAGTRALQRLRTPALTPYRLAQALVVALASKAQDPALLASAAERLAQAGSPDGRWPAETLFRAGDSTAPGYWHYQSWAVVTALCVRALTLTAHTLRS